MSNNKPISEDTKTELYANMGSIIKESFPALQGHIRELVKLNQMIKPSRNKNSQELSNYKNILELHSSVLYVIIEIAVSLRADLRSNIIIEKKINLKYLVFIASEFYKTTFWAKDGDSLWTKVSTYLSSLGVTAFSDRIINIENKIEVYKQEYYNKDKDKRDISIHYDLDLETLYRYLTEVCEESEAQRVCTFLAATQPLNNLLTMYSIFTKYNTSFQEKFVSSETNDKQYLFETLQERLYPKIGTTIQNFATFIDKNMNTYQTLDHLPENLLSRLGTDGINRIKEMRDYAKLVIILHYVYLDLGTTLRGFLSSESFIEKQLHLIRLNLIIYEGYKKIYVPQNKDTKSLWEQYINIPLSLHGQNYIKTEIDSVRSKLEIYKTDKQIKEIRHKYIHLRDRKEFNLPELLDKLLKMKPYDELSKALAFLNLLPRIIKLSKEAIIVASALDSSYNRQQIMEPIMLIKTKILESKISNEDKEQFLKIIDDEVNKIISIIK